MSKKRVVTFHYVLTDKDGKELDSSKSHNTPLTYLEGSGQIIEGLDSELKSMSKGETKKVTILASNAYGERSLENIIEVNRTQFPKESNIKVGDRFQAQSPEGPSPVFTVLAITDTVVKLDGNHPMAGLDLTFDVEIIEAREATDDELSHGHAHGPGGHHHH